jgi:hypothetical protein
VTRRVTVLVYIATSGSFTSKLIHGTSINACGLHFSKLPLKAVSLIRSCSSYFSRCYVRSIHDIPPIVPLSLYHGFISQESHCTLPSRMNLSSSFCEICHLDNLDGIFSIHHLFLEISHNVKLNYFWILYSRSIFLSC